MLNLKRKKPRHLVFLILILELILSCLIYSYIFKNPIPSGTDAIVYLNETKWIINNQSIPSLHQETYHGFRAYPAPFTSLNNAHLYIITKLNETFPLFSLYQLFLVALLILSSYLVGKIYNDFFSLLIPIAVLSSHALIRLFIGSTISNILSFIFINLLYYFTFKLMKTGFVKYLIIILISLVAIFLTHNYLSAPIFIPIYIIYLFFLFIIQKKFRTLLKLKIYTVNKYLLIILLFVILVICIKFVIFYKPVVFEALSAFFNTKVTDKFIGPVFFNGFSSNLGPFLFNLMVVGIFVYIITWKKNLLTYKLFPIFVMICLLLILQTYRFGITFYYERIVFLFAIFSALFATYIIIIAIKINKKSYIYNATLVSIFVILLVISGTEKMKELYDNSNNVTRNQISALKLLNNLSSDKDVIFSHINAVSMTNHDVMISDRDIVHLSTEKGLCNSLDFACLSFNSPQEQKSLEYFKNNRVKFILLLKPSYEGNQLIDNLSKRYLNNINFILVFNTDDVKLFKLI